MKFNPRQKKALEATEPKVLCLATAACGKSIPNSTIIPTPNGLKRVDEIKVGDYLFDRNGIPTKVLGVYPQGKQKVYELTFDDGRKAKSSVDHIWYVNKSNWEDKKEFKEYTVKQLLNLNSSLTNFSIPCAKAVNYSEKQFPIHPYIIGAFLGEGCGLVQSLTFFSETEEIPSYIATYLGNNIKAVKSSYNKYNWKFEDSNNNKISSSILPKELFFQSYDKKIPDEYKYGSIEQRLSLIQGLMDTGGAISGVQEENYSSLTLSFNSTSYQLILDVKEVLGSLGYISSISIKNKKEKYSIEKNYSLIIDIPNSDKYKLFKLKKKKEKTLSVEKIQQEKRYDRVAIKDIKFLGYEEEMTCFLVDNDEHLFLTNDFIVTHNTRVLTERVRLLIEKRNVPPKDIVAITFTNMSANEMKRRLGAAAADSFIGTIHSYGNKICLQHGIDTQKYIDTSNFDEILKRAVQIPQYQFTPIKHLLIDECQDLSPLEYQFLRKIPTENIFFVGDNRQAIYQFRGCTDEYLINMWKDDNYKKYYLTENYRNAPNIIEFADNFLDSFTQLSPQSEPVKTKMGIVERCSFNDALDELEYSQNWSSWFILTRTNNELTAAQEFLEKREIPNVTFKKGDLDGIVELEEIMASNRVKVLTIHSAKGLENKNVIVTGARLYNEEERKIAYVAATRAENALYWCPTIAKKNRGGQKQFSGTVSERVFGKTSQQVITF